MQDFEKLGVFYLGRRYDLKTESASQDLVLYDSADLVTHAVCIGMTGSGKTGLCLTLLEEAAMDGIPVIAIDPKGDIGNLLLTFPDLDAQSFAPWIDEDEARRLGISVQELANRESSRWRQGLQETGQDGERIARLRENCRFAIYTPGGTAGRSISITHFLSKPDEETLEDGELFNERVASAATAVLSLVGIEGDILTSREHILLSSIFASVWQSGQDIELASLIALIQNPPLTRVGAIDLESFFPQKERFALSLKLNNLFASPGFAAWLNGEPLDVDRLLYSEEGKPRISIFSISHLSDEQRMFFVTLMANQMLGWMRRKSGTKSLRAIFYMDEMLGYFPPVANPPSKTPILTLLKQARAFGLGLVLATQNPVDLDYKGLANTGTWFIGRLQTEPDKMRVIDGLEAATAGSGQVFSRADLLANLSRLGKRVFLMNNIHEDQPVIFQTRMTMSYLKGPLTRQEIKSLSADKSDRAQGVAAAASLKPQSKVSSASANPQTAANSESSTASSAAPLLPPTIKQFFLPEAVASFTPARGEWCPLLLASASLRYVDSKSALDVVQKKTYLVPVKDGSAVPVDFAAAREVKLNLEQLLTAPDDAALRFAALPGCLTRADEYKNYSKDFLNWLAVDSRLSIFECKLSQDVSKPGESERDFRIRIAQRLSELRDERVQQLRAKYAPKLQQLEEKVRLAQQKLEAEAAEAKRQDMESALSIGATVLGAFVGRKMGLGRAGTAARGVNRAAKQREDVERAKENLQVLHEKLERLNAEFASEAALAQSGSGAEISVREVCAKKSNISLQLLGVGWVRG